MAKKMGVYIHIPFCVRKCSYCDFLSFCGSDEQKDRYLEAVLSEIESESANALSEFAEGIIIDTIFFGGGTPSAVPSFFIDKILCKLNEVYTIDKTTEISMEINPGTISSESLHNYRRFGINRLSIGVQSFNDEELKALGRIHSAAEAVAAFDMAREAGFENISIDLMSSVPGQSTASMQKNLEVVRRLNPEHLSVYSLIVEEGTPFGALYEKGLLSLPDEDERCQIDELVFEELGKMGLERYEISNYAREGFECRHNAGYWQRKDYRGFGLSAASCVNDIRFTAESDFESYIRDCRKQFSERTLAIEYRSLSKQDKMEEFMFLGLRMCEGIDAWEFEKAFGDSVENIYGRVLDKYIKSGHISRRKTGQETRYFLTEKGLDVANPILAEFLF